MSKKLAPRIGYSRSSRRLRDR